MPGVLSQKLKLRRLRDILLDEVGFLSRDQKQSLYETMERRGGAFYESEVLNRLGLIK